jgi:Polyketide cyclase / dehydrase and lipid transport
MTIIIIIAVAVIGLIILVASRPNDFRVTRSTSVSAPPAIVFAEVNDFHKWEAWSPWLEMDRACKTTFEDASVGKDAIFTWNGNKHVGAGLMTITESHPSDLILIKLEFFKSFKAVNQTEFTFSDTANQTLVTWTMSGKNNFVGKIIGLFINCDKMVGGQFEKGLAKMKAVAETESRER